MPSAFIPSRLGYSAMHLVIQQIHQRPVHPGPLVLRAAPLKYPTPTPDRDRTVSRRSEPSSRTALMGEQPNPWDRLQPQDAMSRHRGAKPLRRCELLGVISLLSQGSFYPLSDGNPTLYHRITKSYFRTCSTRRCRSQAPFCLCTLRMVSNHSEGTFERLRYPFGGDRPSQTPPDIVPQPDHGCWLETQYCKGGIPTLTPWQLASPLPSLPPILYMQYRIPVSS